MATRCDDIPDSLNQVNILRSYVLQTQYSATDQTISATRFYRLGHQNTAGCPAASHPGNVLNNVRVHRLGTH